MKSILRTYYSPKDDLQTPFEIAVILIHDFGNGLGDVLKSIYQQDFTGRIHILIPSVGDEKAYLIKKRPDNVAVTFFDPTSCPKRHIHVVLSFLSHAHRLIYLDHDYRLATHTFTSLFNGLKRSIWARLSDQDKSPLLIHTRAATSLFGFLAMGKERFLKELQSRENGRQIQSLSKKQRTNSSLATKTHESGDCRFFGDHHAPFDCAVVIPTTGRASLKSALQSIYQQDFVGRVQILVGLDKGNWPSGLEEGLPERMGLVLLDLGYSTSKRHGGVFPAYDGGALRSLLSFMTNAPLVAYLDDDNIYHPHHLKSLVRAIKGHHYAFALRRFIHPDGVTPIARDDWESLGPDKGFYAPNYSGFIDPNCLMIRINPCIHALALWTLPVPQDPRRMSADRQVYSFLYRTATGKSTGSVSVDYTLNAQDSMHPCRKTYLGMHWIHADMAALHRQLLATTAQQGQQFNRENAEEHDGTTDIAFNV